MGGAGMTEQEARQEFNELLSDDYDFAVQWLHDEPKEQDQAFYEWCLLWEDLKHIKQRQD